MSYQDDNYRDSPPPLRGDAAYNEQYPEDRARYVPPAEQKKGCSRGCLWGMVGCGCLTVLVGGVILFFVWNIVSEVMRGTSTEPAVVKTKLEEIADITPPADLKPRLAMNLVVAKAVFYSSDDGKSVLQVIQMDPQWAKNKDFEKGFKEGFGEGGQGVKEDDLEFGERVEEKMTIRGKESTVSITDAKAKGGTDEFKIVDTEFPGKASTAKLRWQIPKDKYKEEEVKGFLESIK